MEGRAACLRPRSLAVRADTLEMMLPRVDELSDEKVRMLALSKMLGVSSDFTEEKVLEVTTEAPSLTGRHDVSGDGGKSNQLITHWKWKTNLPPRLSIEQCHHDHSVASNGGSAADQEKYPD